MASTAEKIKAQYRKLRLINEKLRTFKHEHPSKPDKPWTEEEGKEYGKLLKKRGAIVAKLTELEQPPPKRFASK